MGIFKHIICLPDTGAHAEEYFELPLLLLFFFLFNEVKECIGIGTMLIIY